MRRPLLSPMDMDSIHRAPHPKAKAKANEIQKRERLMKYLG